MQKGLSENGDGGEVRSWLLEKRLFGASKTSCVTEALLHPEDSQTWNFRCCCGKSKQRNIPPTVTIQKGWGVGVTVKRTMKRTTD